MAGPKTNKINRLEKELPEGLLVDAAWLESHAFTKQLRNYYVHNGWLEQPARSVFTRSRGLLKWQQVVISLQTLLLNQYGPYVVGGRTALELHGYAHYLPQSLTTVHLYGPRRLPSWITKLPLGERFVYHNSDTLFAGKLKSIGLGSLAWNVKENKGRDLSGLQGGDFTTLAWGQWDWPLTLSSPERAILELLDELPRHESFYQADKLMEGLSNLSPRKLQRLLQDCRSVKVKRLFLFFASRHRHAWLKKLDLQKVDLGSGKRSLVPGGRLDPVYNITVPEDLDANQ